MTVTETVPDQHESIQTTTPLSQGETKCTEIAEKR